MRRSRRNRRRPNYLLLFCIFTLVAVVTGSVSYALTTPTLDVARIDIKGVHLADAKAIDRAASRAIGHNILLVRTGAILARVRGLSEVKNVKMGRRFPNRLWLRVWERRPDAVLASNGCFYWTQADGFVFHRAASPPARIPIISVMTKQQLEPGRRADCLSTKCALEVLRLARRHGLKPGKISVDPQGDICLNMESDFCVRLGQPEEIARKMSLLKNALVHRPSIIREGSYIDLSCPSAPVWRPKTTAPAAS